MVGGSGIGLSSRLGARFRRRPVHLQLGHTVSNANHLTTEIQPTIWKARTAESRARAGPICTDGPAVTLRMWRQASLPDGEGGFQPPGTGRVAQVAHALEGRAGSPLHAAGVRQNRHGSDSFRSSRRAEDCPLYRRAAWATRPYVGCYFLNPGPAEKYGK